MAAMDGPDWRQLFHACGPADEVPAQLAALAIDDRDAAFEASVFVIRALYANGTLTPATVAAMRPIAGKLDEPALDTEGDTVRDALLYLIREIARLTTSTDIEAIRPAGETADWTSDPTEVYLWRARGRPGVALLDRALVDCYDQLPDVFPAVWPIRSHWSTRSRVNAAAAAAMLVRHPQLEARRAEVIAHHEQSAWAATGRWECASYVLGLGLLGVAPTSWLADPRHGVRVCAALAPALADDEEATAILVRAAAHPRAFDHGFSEPFVPPAYRLMLPAHLEPWPRQVLIRTVCERVTDFGRLQEGAIAAVELRGRYRPEPEFGPYLRRAFPASGSGAVTEHQRAFARAIDRRQELWDGGYHGVAEMFAEAGLPSDREWWHDLGHPPMPRNYEGVTLVAVGPRSVVRQRPEMYLGATRTDPSFLTRLVEVVGRNGATVHSELPKRITVAIDGRAETADLDHVVTSVAMGDLRYFGLSVAAAVSLWVDIRVWTDGTAHRREYVDGVPTGDWITTAEDHADGYRFVFDLDEEWPPTASGF